MAETQQARRTDLARLVRRAAHAGISSITALPSQQPDFWDASVIQETLSQVAASISSHFQELAVGHCGPEDDMVTAVDLAATRTLEKSQSDLVASLASSLGQCLAQVRAPFHSRLTSQRHQSKPEVFPRQSWAPPITGPCARYAEGGRHRRFWCLGSSG